MFKRKPKQNPLENAARYFALQQDELARMEDPVIRYLAARDLKLETARFLQAHERAFAELEDQRMLKTIGGIMLGIPAIAGIAIAAGTPLGALLIGPAVAGMAVHSSREHRKADEQHKADMKTHGRAIIAAHQAAAKEMDHILENHSARFAELPGGIRLLQDSSRKPVFNAKAAPATLHSAPKALEKPANKAKLNNNRKGFFK